MGLLDRAGQQLAAQLDAYLAVHDSLFGPSLLENIRRVIPIPGFFRPIPYAEYDGNLTHVLMGVGSILVEIGSCRASSPPEANLRDTLLEYGRRLTTSIQQLQAIVGAMALKAAGAGGPTFAEYRQKRQEYLDSRRHYLAVAERLNLLYRANGG